MGYFLQIYSDNILMTIVMGVYKLERVLASTFLPFLHSWSTPFVNTSNSVEFDWIKPYGFKLNPIWRRFPFGVTSGAE